MRSPIPKRAVILAGGLGTRLKPYTAVLPKPLVPLHGVPILAAVLNWLSRSGVSRVTLAVSHKASIIEEFVGDGSAYGLRVDYSHEEQPLGTVGPLTRIEDLPDRFLVLNGDVLTDLDLRKLCEMHERTDADLTIAASRREAAIDYGVLSVDGRGLLTGFSEKPRIPFLVSMGIYVFRRAALTAVRPGRSYGIDDLALDLLAAGRRVATCEHRGYWRDIGRPEDYELANEEFPDLVSRWRRKPAKPLKPARS